MKKVINNYQKLYENLLALIASPDFKENVKATAKGLSKTLADKNFFMLIHHVCDILDLLEDTSTAFQKRYGVLVEQADNILGLIQGLQGLTSRWGSFVGDALT